MLLNCLYQRPKTMKGGEIRVACQSALGHIRSGILQKCKDTLKKALRGGEMFSSNCIGCCVAHLLKHVHLMKNFFMIISEHRSR